jgi:ABC-type branched-subunit amino acid transport system ATPase component
MTLLQCYGLKKTFGGLNAIDDVDLSVNKGEVLGLIGPNGAGKTTFVNLLAGDVAPTAGRILYCGADISHLASHRRSGLGLARTFQVPRPFASMSIRENLMVGALFGKAKRQGDHRERSAVVSSVLKTTGLERVADRSPITLSTAGLKRLEVARCLASDPDLLFLDEPLGGLNPVETDEAIGLIRDLKSRGVTIIFIEHIIKAVAAVSDRVMVLARGRKLAEGTPQDVLANEEVKRAYLGDVAGALQRKLARSAARRAPAVQGDGA